MASEFIENTPKVINFGCRLNNCESEIIERIAYELGMSGYIIINSCAVTAEAERQVLQAVRKLHKLNPFSKIIVTGCAAEHNSQAFLAINGVCAVIKNSDKLKKTAYLPFANSSRSLSYINKNNVRGYVQIQNGCDNFCTYCLIRQVRGKSVSLPPQDIIESIKIELLNKNIQEIVLTGVNISSYNYGGLNLTNVCKYLLHSIPELRRLRLSSLDPADIDDEFIDFITTESRVMPHIHLSVQSGDDMILKRMRRRHTTGHVIDLISKVLDRRSDVIFGADFICGFPTETDDMALNTEKFLKKSKIVLSHIFPYSERSGTPAALMPQVDKHIRKSRAKKLSLVSQNILIEKMSSLNGTVIEFCSENKWYGKSNNYLPVKSLEPVFPNSIYKGKVIGTDENCLLVEVL